MIFTDAALTARAVERGQNRGHGGRPALCRRVHHEAAQSHVAPALHTPDRAPHFALRRRRRKFDCDRVAAQLGLEFFGAAFDHDAPALYEGELLRKPVGFVEIMLGFSASTLEFRIKKLGIDKFRARRKALP